MKTTAPMMAKSTMIGISRRRTIVSVHGIRLFKASALDMDDAREELHERSGTQDDDCQSHKQDRSQHVDQPDKHTRIMGYHLPEVGAQCLFRASFDTSHRRTCYLGRKLRVVHPSKDRSDTKPQDKQAKSMTQVELARK